jgi:YidC/Oxa1 family membrane protein insertase
MDRNVILFVVLTAATLIGWDILVLGPQREAQIERQKIEQASRPQQSGGPAGDIASVGQLANGPTLPLAEALRTAPGRVAIDTPALSGSINLAGGRIDDLLLRNYRETIDPASPMIRLLSPRETEHGHYIEQGWIVSRPDARISTASATWSVPAGAKLTPTTPVTLTTKVGDLTFEKTYSVDENFMFEVKQTVRNDGSAAATITPYGLVVQRGIPDGAGKQAILHEGPIAAAGTTIYDWKYQKAAKTKLEAEGDRGWVGINNKYWLAAAIPPQGRPFKASMLNEGTVDAPIFWSNYYLDSQTVEPGASAELVSHVYGGAKDADILKAYMQPVEKGGLGIWKFDSAIDWGKYFYWLTRPIFSLLDFFGDHIGNFGVAILLLTLVVKLLMFPLANKAFESMSKMKKLQPKLEELKTRYGEDKMKLQQEMMALYQKEKLNPLAGCMPILIQMPIFYALYKTLFVTIELRHEPFILWIKDLSAPDPTSIFNLFGLLPFEPTAVPVIGAFLGIGVLPLLMGVAMWVQTKMNPPATDPIQQQVLTMMPVIFVFLFASFASGLVLYWVWSTVLSVAQQWFIMKRNGVEVDWGNALPFLKSKKPALEKT